MAKGLVSIDRFRGGLSDTDTRMSEAQFSYAENMEIRRDPDFIELSRKPVSVITTPDMVTAIGIDESISNPVNRYYFTEVGEIYNGAGANVDTLPGGFKIFDTITFNENLLFFYDIGSELKAGVFDTVTETITNADYILPIPGPVPVGGGEACYPIVNVSDDFLYIGSGRNVYRLSQQPGGLLPQLGITFESDIVAITSVGNQIKVFLENGRLYYWDGFSKEYDVYQNTNTKCRYVYSQGNMDYVFGGFNLNYNELYMNQGLQFQLFKKYAISWGADNKEKFNFDLPGTGVPRKCSQAYAQYLNIIYGVTNSSGGSAICSWGQLYNGYPVSFNIDTTTNSAGEKILEIGAINVNVGGPNLFYSYEDIQGNYGVDLINLGWFPSNQAPGFELNNYQSNGFVYTQKYTLDHNKLKRIYEGEVRYEGVDPSENRSIKIYYSLDGEAYELWVTIDQDTDQFGTKLGKFRRFPCPEIKDSFFEIQFKIEMSTDNEEVSPRLYKFDFKYETIQE